MPAAAIVTLALTAVLLVALVVALVWVIVLLRRINDTLGKVSFGIRAIAHRTEPLAEIVTAVNADLTDVAETIEAAADQASPSSAASASSGGR